MIKCLSKISSILPFSLFEILIYILFIVFLILLSCLIYNVIKNPKKILYFFKDFILNIISIMGVIYFLFIILWGINYNRMDLQSSLIEDYNKKNNSTIKTVEYDKEDLIHLYEFLIKQCNKTRKNVLVDKNNVMRCNSNHKETLNRAVDGYSDLSILSLNKKGIYATAKPILNSSLLCYTGTTGIYSPFTGEANINISSPDIYIPFTTLHEMAHQRGYASEDEANFLAYIACINNKDYDFKYSGYILALKYVSSSLANVDIETLKSLNKNISEDVKRDLRNSSSFWSKYEGKVNEVSENMNNTYLKVNGVKEGTISYSKVVNLLLTYYILYEK